MSARRTNIRANRRALMRSDKVLGDMQGNGEKRNGEGNRKGGMQKAAEEFVDFGKCHWDSPYLGSPSLADNP
jgi:hypothetical protein